jgi:hypothetical protein
MIVDYKVLTSHRAEGIEAAVRELMQTHDPMDPRWWEPSGPLTVHVSSTTDTYAGNQHRATVSKVKYTQAMFLVKQS